MEQGGACVECSTVGVSIQEYWTTIGSLNRTKWPKEARGDGQGKENNMKLWFSGVLSQRTFKPQGLH